MDSGKKIANKPNRIERSVKNKRGRQIILKGKDPSAVIKRRDRTKATLQRGPASTGETKNIRTHENFNLGSRFRNQPVFPATYCPIGTFLKNSIF